MAKISTRSNTPDVLMERLKTTLLNDSLGAITTHGGGVAQVGDDLETLVDQATSVISGMCQTIEHVAVDLAMARSEAVQLSLQVDQLESLVESLMGDVSFDDALDGAVIDLMDGFSSSGASEVTADGSLCFDERVTFNKEDIKPYLQRAIMTWIERRIGA
jgi:hypothetical protein